MRKEYLVFIISLMAILLFAKTSYAATYYMNPNGTEDCSNLQECFSLMSGGDTLIIRDGTYTGADNAITPYNLPPSGSETLGYTTIKAEHVGRVVFDGEGERQLIVINGNGMNPQPSYLKFEGLIFHNSLGETVSILRANHIKIEKCMIYDSVHEDNFSGSPLFFRYVDYGLVEDTAIWGEGKYKFYMLDSNHLILRRCLDRFDRGISSSGYHSSFRIYSCNHVELQNCISIDANPDYSLQKLDNGSMIPAHAHFVIWSGGVNGPNDDVHIRGSIILNNNLYDGRAYILQNSYSPKNNTISNSVFWGIYNGLWSRVEQPEGIIFNNIVVGNSSGNKGNGEGVTGECCSPGIVLKNSIIVDIDAYGVKSLDNSQNETDYNLLYGNNHNYGGGASVAPHDYSLENNNEINPLTGMPGNGIPCLKYLPRIEEGSDCYGTGEGGSNRGATILYKIGRDGTLWGEPGWNETTNESLWPWPNEDLIKEMMSQYYYDDPNDNLPPLRGDRGFCKNGTGLYGGPITLTSYIWEYLGNPCPPEICNYSLDYPNCSEGKINETCYCNGTLHSSGYCCTGIWDANACRVFYEDFEDYDWDKGFERTDWKDYVARVPSNPHSGNYCIRGNLKAGRIDPITGLPGISCPHLNLRGNNFTNKTPDEVFVSYWRRLDHSYWNGSESGHGKSEYLLDDSVGVRAYYTRLAWNNHDYSLSWNGAYPPEWHYQHWGHLKAYLGNDNVSDNGADGAWHNYEYYFNYKDHYAKFWVDGHLLEGIGSHSDYIINGTVPVYPAFHLGGIGFFYTHSQQLENSTDGEGYACGWQIDDIEIWDGIPSFRLQQNPSCASPADADLDGTITIAELIYYMNRWFSNSGVSLTQVVQAIREWKWGCGG